MSTSINPVRRQRLTLPRGWVPRSCRLAIAGVAMVAAVDAGAWVLTINPGARTVYLQIGNGSYSGIHNSGGTPQNNSTVNVVSVTVPAAAVGRGTVQAMTSDSTAAISFFDGYTVCSPPSQVYVGGWARTPSGNGNAILTVTSPATLTSGSDTIPFTDISWTSSAIGNTSADIPPGAFTGGTQTLATIRAGTWVENCHTFSYANTRVAAAGTYTGRVTYTLALP